MSGVERIDHTLEYDRFTRRWHWEFLDDGAMACCGSSRTEAEARCAIDDARADYFDEPRLRAAK